MATSSVLLTFKLPNFTLFKTSPIVSKKSYLVPIKSSLSLSDPFVLELTETLEDSHKISPFSIPIQKIRDFSSNYLLNTQWPTKKDEDYRFIDTSFIKSSKISPVSEKNCLIEFSTDTHLPNVVFIDGFVKKIYNLPENCIVGKLSSIEEKSEIFEKISGFVDNIFDGDLFFNLNGVGFSDLIVIYVGENVKIDNPVCLRYYSIESGVEKKELPISNPRVLVVVEKGGEIGVVEEFFGGESVKNESFGGESDENGNYWTNSVIEFVVCEGAKVKHSYVQNQSLNSAHFKWTYVQQESSSTYELVEVSTGGKLSRHNLHVQQLGPDTVTELSTFHLSLNDQTQDLHSKLILDHPRGFTRQLHKCIVAHSSGQAVFDGNVKVNRYAQLTDAGQLTRSLLLEPRATVNVKPNLQIIADDVKCSHGAAISDLEEDQLFYFQARGVDLETARRALVFSFGAEVIQRLPYKFLRSKVDTHIKQLLDPVKQGSL